MIAILWIIWVSIWYLIGYSSAYITSTTMDSAYNLYDRDTSDKITDILMGVIGPIQTIVMLIICVPIWKEERKRKLQNETLKERRKRKLKKLKVKSLFHI